MIVSATVARKQDYRLGVKHKEARIAKTYLGNGKKYHVTVKEQTMRVNSTANYVLSRDVKESDCWFVVRKNGKLVVMDGSLYSGSFLVKADTKQEAVQFANVMNWVM